MAGTKVVTSGTVGVEITLDVQNPVFVSTTGAIVTDGRYALFDAPPSKSSILNKGTLVSTSATGFGIETSGNGAVFNYGLVSGGAYGVYVAGAGKVKNYGSIVAPGTAGIGVELHYGGTVLNGSAALPGAVISGGLDGVLIANGIGTVRNVGVISGSAAGVDIGGSGTVKNFDRITATGTAGDGVLLVNGGTVVNGSPTGNHGALISGGSGGVFMRTGAGTVDNFGTITGITNDGVEIDNVNSRSSTVVNGASGSLKSYLIEGGANGVYVGTGAVTNWGTLIGSVGAGVTIYGGGSVANGDGALIKGVTGVALGGPSTVSTAGTIIGTGGTAIQFGGSNDTLTLQSGAKFVGIVNGGGGFNAIELAAGTGITGGLGSEFVSFGQLSVDTGAAWTLTGSSSIAVVLNNGVLRVGASSSLDISAGVSASSSGVFSLEAGATLDLAADTGTQNSFRFLASANLAKSTTPASLAKMSAPPATPVQRSRTSSPAIRST